MSLSVWNYRWRVYIGTSLDQLQPRTVIFIDVPTDSPSLQQSYLSRKKSRKVDNFPGVKKKFVGSRVLEDQSRSTKSTKQRNVCKKKRSRNDLKGILHSSNSRACEADCFFGILILQTLCLLNHPFSLSLFLFAMAWSTNLCIQVPGARLQQNPVVDLARSAPGFQWRLRRPFPPVAMSLRCLGASFCHLMTRQCKAKVTFQSRCGKVRAVRGRHGVRIIEFWSGSIFDLHSAIMHLDSRQQESGCMQVTWMPKSQRKSWALLVHWSSRQALEIHWRGAKRAWPADLIGPSQPIAIH